MIKFCVGDLVVFKRDNNIKKRVYIVLAVSDIYDSLKLAHYSDLPSTLRSCFHPFWWPKVLVRKVSFCQPELTVGVN